MKLDRNTARRTLRAALLVGAPVLVIAACDSDPADPGGDDDGHAEGARAQIEVRGTSTVLGIWTEDDGWTDSNGEPITELPAAVEGNDGLQQLVAGGPRAELTVRFFEGNGEEEEFGTLSEDDTTGERECTEHEGRYVTAAGHDDTEVIAWPNMSHPDSDGAAQFAERSGGELVPIFRCDHVLIYPETAGTVDIEFLLWHLGHDDARTDPVTVRVE